MSVVGVRQAKTHLSRLLAQVEADEEIVIACRGKPVARLVSYKPQGKRQPDVLKGRVVLHEGFFEPLLESELRTWEGK